jgi:hypothetical protein
MTIRWSLCISLSLFNAVSGWAQGADRHAGLKASAVFSVGPTANVRKEMAAWPKITSPRTPAVDRANAIIAAMNQSTLDALRNCDDLYRGSLGLPNSARVKADWLRRITVTMHGPRFVAMVATETSFCGGAYPLNDHAAMVFDMTTGELVNWQKFFAAVDGAAAEPEKAKDGATSSEIVAPVLTNLALERAEGPECKRALEDFGELVFQVWPDARRGQLMLKATGQPHVTQACEETIGLSLPKARKLGISKEVLDAIEQAHRINTSSPKR